MNQLHPAREERSVQRDAQAAVAREYGYESWTQGHVWELEASRGRIVFTELLDYAPPEDIEVEAGLGERALADGIRTPAPIRTIAGTVIAPLEGTNWRTSLDAARPRADAAAIAADRRGGRTCPEGLHALALPAPSPSRAGWTFHRPEPPWYALADRARSDGVAWAGAIRCRLRSSSGSSR